MSETTTKTTEATATELAEMLKDVPQEVLPPLFLIFAEFLGYVSPLMEWVDKSVEKKLEPFQRNILIMDSKVIFERMKSEFDIPTIKEYWDMLYPAVLIKYDEKIKTNWEMPF